MPCYRTGTRLGCDLEELLVVPVPVDQPRLVEVLSHPARIDVRVDVAVGNQNVLPSVVVEIHKSAAPTHEVRVHGQARRPGDLGKGAVAEIAIEVRRIVGKVRLQDVQETVAIEVRRRRAHAGLLVALFIKRDAGVGAHFLEGPITLVEKVQTGRGIAGDIDVRPAIVIEVAGKDGEAGRLGCIDAGLVGYVGEMAVAVIVIKRHRLRGQSHGTAGDGESLPRTGPMLARTGHFGGIELEVMRHHQVQVADPVVVEKCAAGAPARRRAQPALLRLVAESAVPLVAPKRVLSPGGDEEIDVAVIVGVARADALSPAVVQDAGFPGYVFESEAAQIVIEVVRRRLTAALEAIAIDEEDVGQSVIVVVEDRQAGAGVLDDVGLLLVGTGDDHARQTGLRGQILKAHHGCSHSWGQRFLRLGRSAAAPHLRRCDTRQDQHQSHARQHDQQCPLHFLSPRPAGSRTVRIWSAAMSVSLCTVPLGHVISSSRTVFSWPNPKCTRLSLADW